MIMSTKKLSRLQHAARILLGTFLFFAGVAHLTFARIDFQAQVPNWVPLNTDLVVLLSGIAEILLGLLTIIIGHKKQGFPWLIALFFIAIFPGNWSQYINQRDAFGLDTDSARLARLFFQPILIFWALWSMGASPRRSK